jgi:hypothetical protein
MRSTTSRFSSFATPVDPNLEGRPTVTRAVAPGSLPAHASARAVINPQQSVLEQKYPAVLRALTLLWGFPEMNQYFDKVSSGSDPSLSLEPAAMAELMLLASVHRRICPYQPAKAVEDLYGAGRWADTWKPARSGR